MRQDRSAKRNGAAARSCEADAPSRTGVRRATALAGLRGRFVLSLNDTPEVRGWFAAFHQEPVGTHYGVAGGMQAARELIITGPA